MFSTNHKTVCHCGIRLLGSPMRVFFFFTYFRLSVSPCAASFHTQGNAMKPRLLISFVSKRSSKRMLHTWTELSCVHSSLHTADCKSALPCDWLRPESWEAGAESVGNSWSTGRQHRGAICGELRWIMRSYLSSCGRLSLLCSSSTWGKQYHEAQV